MQRLTLHIASKDWVYIFGIGLFFSLSLSLLCYFLVEFSLFNGFIFGTILGTCLSLWAILLTTSTNRYILPYLSPKYWKFFAGAFSFLSGFMGTLSAYFCALALHVKMLEKFENHFSIFALFIGLMSYVIANLLYQFIIMSNAKEYHEKLLIKSRLKSLERQLNPHFLFNALNSLAELLHVNTSKAESALLQLSAFLRSSMKESSLILVQEELDNVERYVALENIRFDDKIFLFIDSQPTLLSHEIPKFSIQLIVENAIKHGFKHRNLNISISITQKEKLEITICNDGQPITNKSFGIGLNNLKERLYLLCDGKLVLQETAHPTFLLSIGEKR